MGLTLNEFVNAYPRLYHMASSKSWDSIQRHGLLSTTALLDLFGVQGAEREAIESKHRPDSVSVNSAVYGTAVIRDQKPMRESALSKCLQDCSPQDWYEFLNRHTFFWPTLKKVQNLLGARAYRTEVQLVLEVDSNALLTELGSAVLLSPINSGSTIYRAVPRSFETFYPLASYPFLERKQLRGIQDAVAEVLVPHSVPKIASYVSEASLFHGDTKIQTLFKR